MTPEMNTKNYVKCEKCDGKGGSWSGPKRRGQWTDPSPFGNDPSNEWHDCPFCDGEGLQFVPDEA